MKHLSPLSDVGGLHPELSDCGLIRISINDGESRTTSALRIDAALYKLIREHKPKGGVIFVVRIHCCGEFVLAQDIDELIDIERKAEDSPNGTAEIHREIAGI